MLKVKKVKPRYDMVITTCNKYENDVVNEAGIIETSGLAGSIKEYQTVIAVGDMVRNLKEGDVVIINPENYVVRRFEEDSVRNDFLKNQKVGYNFPIRELNGEEALFLKDRDIEMVLEDFEETEDRIFVVPDKKLIVN